MNRLLQEVGNRVSYRGWITGFRKQKKWTFIDISKGFSPESLQVIVKSEDVDPNLGYHSAIRVEGTIKKSPEGKSQLIEMVETKITDFYPVENPSEYPFGPRHGYTPNFIRQYPHFRSKLPEFSSLLRLRNNLSINIRNYFHQNEFLEISTPILTSNDCEGAGEVFKVEPDNPKIIQQMRNNDENDDVVYFNKKVYLTVSAQLHLEAICNGIERVYTFNPSFRAEMGRTRRHLSEFIMIEAEIAFLDSVNELMSVMESLVKSSFESVLSDTYTAVDEERVQLLSNCLKNDFLIVTYDEIMKRLCQCPNQFQVIPKIGASLGKEHELYITDNYAGNKPVFVTEFPQHLSPFYCRSGGGVDCLLPGIGEVIGGSLRERDPEILTNNIQKLGIPLDSIGWYLDLRKNGSAPTGGFGLGFERLVQFITGIPNIQDTIPFPRNPHNCIL